MASNQIRQALVNSEFCPAVFLNVSRAFDRVWHARLLHKLSETLPAVFCQIIKSFLEDRFFRVGINLSYSELSPIDAGVRDV